MQESGGYLIEQQLTVEEVPVIVDKCINFISTHGKEVTVSYHIEYLAPGHKLVKFHLQSNLRKSHK